MKKTTATALEEIKRQLDWRGPTGKMQGHIVIRREEAEALWEEFGKLRPDNGEKSQALAWDRCTAGAGPAGFLSSYRPELYERD